MSVFYLCQTIDKSNMNMHHPSSSIVIFLPHFKAVCQQNHKLGHMDVGSGPQAANRGAKRNFAAYTAKE